MARPSDDALEKALREAVANVFKSGKMEELTVKRMRLAAENALEVEEGFFKSNADWKGRSEEVIRDEVVSFFIGKLLFALSYDEDR